MPLVFVISSPVACLSACVFCVHGITLDTITLYMAINAHTGCVWVCGSASISRYRIKSGPVLPVSLVVEPITACTFIVIF